MGNFVMEQIIKWIAENFIEVLGFIGGALGFYVKYTKDIFSLELKINSLTDEQTELKKQLNGINENTNKFLEKVNDNFTKLLNELKADIKENNKDNFNWNKQNEERLHDIEKNLLAIKTYLDYAKDNKK